MKSSRQAGYILAEFLMAALVVLILCWGIGVQSQAYLQKFYRAQVRAAAGMVAADLRFIQMQTMLSPHGTQVFYPHQDSRSYEIGKIGVSQQRRNKNFTSMGCEGVYFVSAHSIEFKVSGNVASSTAVILGHDKLNSFQCKISAEPVTGRTTLSESE